MKGTEAKSWRKGREEQEESQRQGRREQEESASPLLRRRRPELEWEEERKKNGEREGVKEQKGEVDERREEVRCCSTSALTGDTSLLTPRGTKSEVTTPSSQVFPQIPGTPPFAHLTPPPTPSTMPVSPPYTLPFTHPYTLGCPILHSFWSCLLLTWEYLYLYNISLNPKF